VCGDRASSRKRFKSLKRLLHRDVEDKVGSDRYGVGYQRVEKKKNKEKRIEEKREEKRGEKLKSRIKVRLGMKEDEKE
jgi:hypothetical protein